VICGNPHSPGHHCARGVIDVMAGGGGVVTVISVDADLVESSVDVAVTVALPVPLGVNTADVEEAEMVPPVAVHLTVVS